MEEYLWQYVMMVNPFVKEEDIEEVRYLNDWDLLIVFKNGKKILYDTYNNFHRNITYSNVNELTDEQEKKEFAYRLRSIMGRKWITQEELAKKLGTSQAMVSRYVSGKAIPGGIMLRNMSKILNCSMDDFFNLDI